MPPRYAQMGHARFSEPNRWLYDVTAKDDAEVYVHYVDAGSVNQRSLGLVPDQSVIHEGV